MTVYALCYNPAYAAAIAPHIPPGQLPFNFGRIKVWNSPKILGGGWAVIREDFQGLTDPRLAPAQWHNLLDIVALTLGAAIGGADNGVEIAEFGPAKADGLRGFLPLPNGIPAHDTLGWVFSRRDPEPLPAGFRDGAPSISPRTQGEGVALDGKTLRGRGDRGSGRRPLPRVSPWATAHRLTRGPGKTAAKSNEIKAIPQRLERRDLRGCLVTLDAMGGQKSIARQIVAGDANYLLAVKSNQGQLYDQLQDAFRCAEGWDPLGRCREVGKGHGRLEVRQRRVIAAREELDYMDPAGEWPQLSSVAQVSYERPVGVGTPERRYYICSRRLAAAEFLQSVRDPWGIENQLPWIRAGAFAAEHCRGRTGHAAANLSVVRQMALNRLNRETSRPVGRQAKRKRAGWDGDSLPKILAG